MIDPTQTMMFFALASRGEENGEKEGLVSMYSAK